MCPRWSFFWDPCPQCPVCQLSAIQALSTQPGAPISQVFPVFTCPGCPLSRPGCGEREKRPSLTPPPLTLSRGPSLQALGSDGVRVTMESALTARDRVGVQDFVLLENFTSEAAFIENLRRRFRENLIYVRPEFRGGGGRWGRTCRAAGRRGERLRGLWEKLLSLLLRPPDLHWPRAGLCQPLPRPADLQPTVHGALSRRQLL